MALSFFSIIIGLVKILQLIPYYLPASSYGGPVTVCSQISEYFASQGHTVTVATTDAGDDNKRLSATEEKISGVFVHRFPNLFPFLTKKWNIFTPLHLNSWLTTHIKEYDIVHLHSYFTYQNIIASSLCIAHGIPNVVHLHESPVPIRDRGKYLIKCLYTMLFGKKILLNASKIITLTELDKSEVSQYLPSVQKNIIIIPNGVNFSHAPLLEDKKKLRKKYHIGENTTVILSLSRLSYLKGVDLLLSAFYELTKINKDVLLLIAGPDEGMLDKLKRYVATHNLDHTVRFLGTVTGKDKQSVYRISDLYALFSRYEPFGITVLEALSSRLPVCISHAVGIGNIVIQKQSGIWITDHYNAKKSSSDLLEAIRIRKNLSKNSRKTVELFQLKNQCVKIERIYEDEIASFRNE